MNRKISLIMILCLCRVILLLPAAIALAEEGIPVKPGTMLHAQQALERYDTAGEPILQYLETWMDASRRLQREVGEDGQALSYAFSSENEHLAWRADTMKAAKLTESPVFLPDYTALKSDFDKETALSGQVYAGRNCAAILLENMKNEEDWLKVYLDNETGFVLFCEAPLFRLRTSLLEIVPADNHLLTPPEGLVF